MTHFHGQNSKGPFFEGWYLKHQEGGKTLALIPALHIDKCGKRTASLQVISDEKSFQIAFGGSEFFAFEDQFIVGLGDNLFGYKGLRLDCERGGHSLHGKLYYGPLTPLPSDIMGPFRFLPAMQCNHGVVSLSHTLRGQLMVDGEVFDFTGGTGYIEKDWGKSFPKQYLWTQANWRERHYGEPDCLMLAIADVPTPIGSFTGCICHIHHDGRHIRLATYRGAQVKRYSPRGAQIQQGRYTLHVVQDGENDGHPLWAPQDGSMVRTVHENPACPVHYRLYDRERLVLDRRVDDAGFESGRTSL